MLVVGWLPVNLGVLAKAVTPAKAAVVAAALVVVNAAAEAGILAMVVILSLWRVRRRWELCWR